jgi:hypothetical protein
MKLSEFKEPFKTETIETLKRFSNQLIQAGDNWGLNIVKYLILVNAGGAVALLGYMGTSASKNIPITLGLKFGLICFFLGISSAGGLLSTMLYGARRSFNKLSENGEQYFQDKLDWETLLKNTKNEHSKTLEWADLLGWSSFSFFFALEH